MKTFFRAAIAVLILCGVASAGPQGTSSTTGTAMIARARTLLNEPAANARRWSEAQMLEFLNAGMIDLALKAKCYQTSEAVTLVANTVEYTPTTTTYIEVADVKINPASGSAFGLKRGNIRSVGAEPGTHTTPKFWYEYNGKVGIYPAYSAVTTETATVYLVNRPAAIAAGSNVLTPAALDQALVYYITAQALLRDRRPQEASNYLTMYQQEVDLYRKDVAGADNETTTPIR
jgi:hypothetical protein